LKSADLIRLCPYSRVVFVQLGLQFRDFEHSHDLTLADVRAIVDIQLLDVASHLGVHVDFLVGYEFGTEGQVLGDGPRFRNSRPHGDHALVVVGLSGSHPLGTGRGHPDCKKQDRCGRAKETHANPLLYRLASWRGIQ
jgi:hypothetical protein